MKERYCWAVACVSFHIWAWLIFTDAPSERCWALFAVMLAWFGTAVFKTLDRKGGFD